MADDIVTRLRELGRYVNTEGGRWFEPITTEAADEIERLRAEANMWRGVCERFAESDPRFDAFRYYFKAVTRG